MSHQIKNLKYELDYLKIAVTKKCNYNCFFCSQSDFLNNRTLEFEPVLKHVLLTFNPRLIILTGGEPLLKTAIVKKYIKHCAEKNIELGIFTNMSLLSPEMSKEMSQLEKIWLRTTINGANAETHEISYPKGSFRTLLNKIDVANQSGLLLKARVTISKKNYREIPDIVNLVRGLDISEIDFRPYAPLSYNNHDEYLLTVEQHLRSLKLIVALKDEFPLMKITLLPNWFDFIVLQNSQLHNCALCYCGKTYLYIDSNGDILTCAGYRNRLGNIYKDDIRHVYNESPFLQEVRQENFGEYCESCPIYYQCRKSNCHVVNFEVYNSLKSVNPLCPIFKLSPADAHIGYQKVREIYNSL